MLQQNESICNLYQNKNYVPPDPRELEAIVEETNPEETQGGRARRAQDVAFVLGAKKEKRLIEPYKYWRVDNKDKNKKRKTMAGKLWKGRKKPKLESLTPDEEAYLSELIAAEDGDEDSADSERCVWGQGVGDFNSSATSDSGQCVWGALEQHAQATAPEATTAVRRNNQESLECSPQKRVASDAFKEPSIFDGRERRLEERETKKKRQDESAVEKAIINTEDEGTDRDHIRQSIRIQQRNSTPGHSSNTESNDDDLSKRDQSGSSENRLQNDPNSYLASLDESLTNLIPAEELEEMMSEDFLFCGGAGRDD